MKWKTPKGLKTGDKRQVQYFALLPTELGDGYTVWLERFWAEETYDECKYDGLSGVWTRTRSWSKE
mgnify:CR=1 FL=1